MDNEKVRLESGLLASLLLKVNKENVKEEGTDKEHQMTYDVIFASKEERDKHRHIDKHDERDMFFPVLSPYDSLFYGCKWKVDPDTKKGKDNGEDFVAKNESEKGSTYNVENHNANVLFWVSNHWKLLSVYYPVYPT